MRYGLGEVIPMMRRYSQGPVAVHATVVTGMPMPMQ
jgi:hypothetical protein